MARTIPAALQTFLDGDGRQGCPALVTITRRDGTVIRITSYETDLVNGGDTFTATGLNLSEIEIGINETPTSGEFDVSLTNSSPISANHIVSGLYRRAKYQIAVCDPANVASSFLTLVKGRVGAISMASNELRATFELKGSLSGSVQGLVVERYSPTCREIIGGPRCRLPVLPADGVTHITERADSTAYVVGDYIRVQQSGSWDDRNYLCTTAGTTAASQPVYDTTVGNDTTDGTAVFTAEQAWAREATVVSQTGQSVEVTVTEARAVDDTWFRQGICAFDGGANAGLESIDIIEWDNTNKIAKLSYAPVYGLTAGEKLFLIPGDDKTGDTCAGKFANILNFVGERYTNPYGTISFTNSI